MSALTIFNRRQALTLLAGFAATRPLSLCGSISAQTTPSRDAVETLLRPLFTTNDPSLFRLAVDAYSQCILGRLRPPEPPFQHSWLIPGGMYYGQWLWDTTFVTDLLAILPDQSQIIRGVYQNFWDFCDRWNAAQPEYAHGMVANFIRHSSPSSTTGWLKFPAYSQAPLLAWGIERVYQRNHDLQLVRTALPYLDAFHEWYWRERDVTQVGLIGVGAYSGVAQHARYETYDYEVDLDSLQLTKHPTRRGAAEGNWYGDILIPANTAYLLLSELCLARLANAAGDHRMASKCLARYKRGQSAMREHMWDDDAGCFLAVRRDSLAKIDNPTVGGFTPLMALVPTKAQAARMAETLSHSDWNTPLPIPTVRRSDKSFVSDGFWRGDTWPAPVYQVATGLAHYNLLDTSARLARASIANAVRVGISEHYDSLSGKPLGVSGLGMSAVVLTMALDGLSPAHRISVASPASS
jgi:glycogen debranching enzyme